MNKMYMIVASYNYCIDPNPSLPASSHLKVIGFQRQRVGRHGGQDGDGDFGTRITRDLGEEQEHFQPVPVIQ